MCIIGHPSPADEVRGSSEKDTIMQYGEHIIYRYECVCVCAYMLVGACLPDDEGFDGETVRENSEDKQNKKKKEKK